MSDTENQVPKIKDPLTRWRLIFGSDASDPQDDEEFLDSDTQKVDVVLEKLYGKLPHTQLKNTGPDVNKWLGDIKKYFPKEVTLLLQKDALERLGITKMLLKPNLLEQLEVDVQLLATILNLQGSMPEETRSTARIVVDRLVEKLEEKLSFPLIKAVHGALSEPSPKSKPRMADVDWSKTIRYNLKYYQKEYQTIIPKRIYAKSRKSRSIPEIILCVDQSASMASSVVYASIYSCVLAKIRSIRTSLILFDSIPYDFTTQLDDPVDVLFGLNLGGGTDINRAIHAARSKIVHHKETIFILISDLEEGGNSQEMLTQLIDMKENGTSVLILLTLSDEGKPRYDQKNAQVLANNDIPCIACTPDQFPEIVADALRKNHS